MAGGTSLPYGNVKNLFMLSCTPSGTNVSATSVTIATGGAIVTFTVPGILSGDSVLEANRQSNTINGNTAPAVPWVGVGNMWASGANTVSLNLTNTSTLAVSTPIDTYIITVARADSPNPPSTLPSGIV